MREVLKASRSDDLVAGIPGDYPLAGDLCIAGDSTHQTAADTAAGIQSEVTDGGTDEILSTYGDRWYVPDSAVYDYAVRTLDGERRYLKTKAGVTDLLERLYSDSE